MSIIHNGFIDRKFNDSFKDTGLNNVDIATTKMYKGVKPMWHQLGFKNENKDFGTNLQYKKQHKTYLAYQPKCIAGNATLQDGIDNPNLDGKNDTNRRSNFEKNTLEYISLILLMSDFNREISLAAVKLKP